MFSAYQILLIRRGDLRVSRGRTAELARMFAPTVHWANFLMRTSLCPGFFVWIRLRCLLNVLRNGLLAIEKDIVSFKKINKQNRLENASFILYNRHEKTKRG